MAINCNYNFDGNGYINYKFLLNEFHHYSPQHCHHHHWQRLVCEIMTNNNNNKKNINIEADETIQNRVHNDDDDEDGFITFLGN